jgi:hypothetical protein
MKGALALVVTVGVVKRMKMITYVSATIFGVLVAICKPMQTSAEGLCCRDTSEVPDEKFDGRILYYFISLPSIPIKLCKTNIFH